MSQDFSKAVAIPARMVSAAGVSSDSQIHAAAQNLCIVGFSVAEVGTPPTAAKVFLRHGDDAADPMICKINLAPGETTREWWGPEGIKVSSGIFLDWVSGTMDITVFVKQPDIGTVA